MHRAIVRVKAQISGLWHDHLGSFSFTLLIGQNCIVQTEVSTEAEALAKEKSRTQLC